MRAIARGEKYHAIIEYIALGASGGENVKITHVFWGFTKSSPP